MTEIFMECHAGSLYRIAKTRLRQYGSSFGRGNLSAACERSILGWQYLLRQYSPYRSNSKNGQIKPKRYIPTASPSRRALTRHNGSSTAGQKNRQLSSRLPLLGCWAIAGRRNST